MLVLIFNGVSRYHSSFQDISFHAGPAAETQALLRKEIKAMIEKDPKLSEDALYHTMFLQV
jgi:hypothetical protein